MTDGRYDASLPERRRTELSPAWTGPRVWICCGGRWGHVQSSRGGDGPARLGPDAGRLAHRVLGAARRSRGRVAPRRPRRPCGRRCSLGTVVVLGAAYQFVGLPAIRSRERAPGARLPAGADRLRLLTLIGIYPQSVFLLFIASPQIWLLQRATMRDADRAQPAAGGRRRYGAAVERPAGPSDAFWDILPWMVVSLVVSLLFGIWIDKVITQSQQRAELIEQLEAARDELAEAHHSGRRDGRAGADGAGDPRHARAGDDEHRDARADRRGRVVPRCG